MGLGRQERRGVIILTVVTLLITGCGLTMRYCVPHAKPMPGQVVVYKTDTITDTVYRERKRKAYAGDSARTKKKYRNKKEGRKPGREKKTPATAPVRDFLKDTIGTSASASVQIKRK